MHRGNCLCLCSDWHDMHNPHWHKVSSVDLAVKTIAMAGAFRLLQQVRQGARTPQVQAFIPVDIVGTDLYALLTSVEKLFIQSGLQGDWRAASLKQRVRGVFGTLVEQQRLKVAELDLLISQSVYKYASDLPSHAEPLQLFDFLELLKKVGSHAFATEPRRAVNLVLAALEVSLISMVPVVHALLVEPRDEVSATTKQSSVEG